MAGGRGAWLADFRSLVTSYNGAAIRVAGFSIQAVVLMAGVIVGVAETLGTMLVSPAYSNAISLLLLVIVLIGRPSGLMGRKFFAEL